MKSTLLTEFIDAVLKEASSDVMIQQLFKHWINKFEESYFEARNNRSAQSALRWRITEPLHVSGKTYYGTTAIMNYIPELHDNFRFNIAHTQLIPNHILVINISIYYMPTLEWIPYSINALKLHIERDKLYIVTIEDFKKAMNIANDYNEFEMLCKHLSIDANEAEALINHN